MQPRRYPEPPSSTPKEEIDPILIRLFEMKGSVGFSPAEEYSKLTEGKVHDITKRTAKRLATILAVTDETLRILDSALRGAKLPAPSDRYISTVNQMIEAACKEGGAAIILRRLQEFPHDVRSDIEAICTRWIATTSIASKDEAQSSPVQPFGPINTHPQNMPSRGVPGSKTAPHPRQP